MQVLTINVCTFYSPNNIFFNNGLIDNILYDSKDNIIEIAAITIEQHICKTIEVTAFCDNM